MAEYRPLKARVESSSLSDPTKFGMGSSPNWYGTSLLMMNNYGFKSHRSHQKMFKPRRKYRHKNCVDIDFIVKAVLGENEEIVSLIVTYWNRRGFPQGGRDQVVSVQKKDLPSWIEVGRSDSGDSIAL